MTRYARREIYCENQGICPLVEDKSETPIIRKAYESTIFKIKKIDYSCTKGECTLIDRMNAE